MTYPKVHVPRNLTAIPKANEQFAYGGIGCPICLSETYSRGDREMKRSHVCDETGCNASLIYTRLHQPSIMNLEYTLLKIMYSLGQLLLFINLLKLKSIVLRKHVWSNIFHLVFKVEFRKSKFEDTCISFQSK